MKPLVTAMMLTRNRKEYLREAIKSILDQTYPNFELIVIDNGSTDGTEELFSKFMDNRIVYIRNKENVGCPKSRNQTLEIAKGKYIAICDDDDISMPDRFEKCVSFLEANPDVGLVCGNVKFMYMDEKKITPVFYNNPITHEGLLKSDGLISSPSVMFRKEFPIGYDENCKIGSDYEFYIRFSKKYKIVHLNHFLAKYRIHENNMSLGLKFIEDKKKDDEYIRKKHG